MDTPRCLHTLSILTVTITSSLTAVAETRVTNVTHHPSAVALEWQGGSGPWIVETSRDWMHWCDQGDLMVDSNCTLSAFNEQQFYRIVEVNPTNGFGTFFGLLQTEQGESGALLGRHRLKSRLWLYRTREAPHASPSATPLEYWRKLLVTYQRIADGRVRTSTGALETLGTVSTPSETSIAVTWAMGADLSLRTFVLTLDFPYSINVSRSLIQASDPNITLECNYASEQPELDGFPMEVVQVTRDTTRLVELAPDEESWWPSRDYRVSKNGAQVNLQFQEGLPLFQGSPPFIFKTFILNRWLSPSTGGGGSLPEFSTDSWFARTLLPGHHNFTETALLEPALDPALSETARAALSAANIRYVYTMKDLELGLSLDDLRFIGYDDSLRDP